MIFLCQFWYCASDPVRFRAIQPITVCYHAVPSVYLPEIGVKVLVGKDGAEHDIDVVLT